MAKHRRSPRLIMRRIKRGIKVGNLCRRSKRRLHPTLLCSLKLSRGSCGADVKAVSRIPTTKSLHSVSPRSEAVTETRFRQGGELLHEWDGQFPVVRRFALYAESPLRLAESLEILRLNRSDSSVNI